ncbi:hypothetical protein [Mesorhizobium sp. GbtcB19]|uniref:hypothetical protein n=1 Tax=Mesorhizobium sp. GbtcB19 TaxID=2824764 RepID=UPI001C3000DB|nr:hypothetical protein [Mesorhizobium sp. GbtcB19]
MNAHVEPTAIDPKEYEALRSRLFDLEDNVAELARHCRAMHIVADSVFGGLRTWEKHYPRATSTFAELREDFSVMETMVCDADVLARKLKDLYYRGFEIARPLSQ